MTVTPTLVPGVTYVPIDTSALELKHRYTAVPVHLPVPATAVHIVIKQEYDALELREVCVLKLETYDSLVELITMKES